MTLIVALFLAAVIPGAPMSDTERPVSPTDTGPGAINVRDFGCVGDGIVDDGPCLQAALDAASLQQRGVYFPAPRARYRTLRELWLRRAYGIRIFGDNPWTTTIHFDLPRGATGLWVYNCYGVTFESLQFRGSDTSALNAVVNVQGDSTDPLYGRRAPGSNRFNNLRIVGGEAYSEYGVRYTIARSSFDWNNDLSIWTGVDVAKTRTAGVSIEHANSKSHQFHDCKFLFMGRGKPSSQRGAPGGWDSYPADFGYGIWLKAGSFHWHGGYMGVVKGSYFRLDALPVDGVVIRDGDFESGGRILDVTPVASMPFHVIFEGNRYSAAFTNAPGASSERDSQVIRIASAVVASIRSNFFGESGQLGVTKLAFTSVHPGFVEIVGNAFESVGAAGIPDLISSSPSVELDVHGNTFRTSGPNRVLRRGVAPGQNGSSAHLPAAGITGASTRGTAIFSGATRSQDIPLADSVLMEPGTEYYVATSPAYGIEGSPPSEALRLRRLYKARSVMTLELEQAPGEGASVRFDWIVVR